MLKKFRSDIVSSSDFATLVSFYLAVQSKTYSLVQCRQTFSVNDTHRERLVFHSIQYRNGWMVASNLFDMFTQSIKFHAFRYQHRCLKNVIHQIDNKNGSLLLSASFTAKFGLSFVLTLENAFS